MNKSLLIIALAYVLTCSCQQKTSFWSDMAMPVVPKRYTTPSSPFVSIRHDTVYVNHKLYSGYLYQLNPTTQDTLSVEGYIQGLQSGKSRKWYENHQLMEVRNFTKGQKNGWQIAYWENGNKRFEFMAHDDAYEGELKEWNMRGELFHLAHFVNGQEEGEQKLWYDNGKLIANYVIIHGKRYGLLGTRNCKNVSDSIFVVK